MHMAEQKTSQEQQVQVLFNDSYAAHKKLVAHLEHRELELTETIKRERAQAQNMLSVVQQLKAQVAQLEAEKAMLEKDNVETPQAEVDAAVESVE